MGGAARRPLRGLAFVALCTLERNRSLAFCKSHDAEAVRRLPEADRSRAFHVRRLGEGVRPDACPVRRVGERLPGLALAVRRLGKRVRRSAEPVSHRPEAVRREPERSDEPVGWIQDRAGPMSAVSDLSCKAAKRPRRARLSSRGAGKRFREIRQRGDRKPWATRAGHKCLPAGS